MAGISWSESVAFAVRRLAARNGSAEFSRRQLLDAELPRIIDETGSRGATPDMTLSRLLQEMRDNGEVEFLGRGQYRLLDEALALPATPKGKAIVCLTMPQVLDDAFDRYWSVPAEQLAEAASIIGQWIIFADGLRGCFAVARVEQIVRDPAHTGAVLALVEPGSFLEFGVDVPVPLVVTGAGTITLVTDGEFDTIIAAALVDETSLLPREEAVQSPLLRQEARDFSFAPVERSVALTSRKVRDPQFRKRVLDAYDRRCAFTGMQLINGGGRAEAQAAHIMSVSAGGPDRVANGIALSGTVHWMFDRGLLSLSDSGDILIAEKLGDAAAINRLIHPDRRAWLPDAEIVRPHQRFLAWHREYHGLG